MKSTASHVSIVLGALLVLGSLNFAIVHKERIRRDGEIVYLPLAPVDPRSLMQGDYLALRFALALEIERRDPARGQVRRQILHEGDTALVAVTLDDRRVAHLAGDAAAASMKLRYRLRQGRVWLGTNAFFFEEGTAQRFQGARYGEFHVDRRSGEAVLTGLRNEVLEPL